jgi:hypothetical protein
MNNSIFLHQLDLIRLTGTKIKKLQIEHLSRCKIPFKVDRNGCPLVIKDNLLECSSSNIQIKRKTPSVNFTPLN